MPLYRRYEYPRTVKKMLEEAREKLSEDPQNEFLHEDVEELEERLNFAWQDEEAEEMGLD